jgi:hypothetical protein
MEFMLPERKVHFSLSQRGRVRVGVNDINGLYSPPPAPPAGRGVFVQALAHALHLCAYQLKDPTAFNQLAETPEGISKLLQCQRFNSGVAKAGVLSRSGIQPGDFLTLTLDRAEGARYFGIVAGYQILDKERTVRLINIPVVVEIIISAQQIERVQKPDLLNIDLHLGPQQIRKAVIMKWLPKK